MSSYHISSLEEAKQHQNGVVYIEGGDTSIYVVSPASLVLASESDIEQLAIDISERLWPGEQAWNKPRVSYGLFKIGEIVGPHKNKGLVTQEIWIDQAIVQKGLSTDIIAIIRGEASRVQH